MAKTKETKAEKKEEILPEIKEKMRQFNSKKRMTDEYIGIYKMQGNKGWRGYHSFTDYKNGGRSRSS